MLSSQAGSQAAILISDILADREKSKTESLTLQERLAIAQVCATLSVGHEINGLAQAVYRLAERAEPLAGVVRALVALHEKTIHVSVRDAKA